LRRRQDERVRQPGRGVRRFQGLGRFGCSATCQLESTAATAWSTRRRGLRRPDAQPCRLPAARRLRQRHPRHRSGAQHLRGVRRPQHRQRRRLPATCTFEFCGDGIVNNGELCDRTATPETCNPTARRAAATAR
jgi:hypothetical protein